MHAVRRGGGLLAAGPLSADPLNRLSADFQNSTSLGGGTEIATNLAPPGILVYTKSVVPIDRTTGQPLQTLYVTFSAQADVHNGSALLMTATVNGQFCQPLLGETAGGGTTFPNWYTLLRLPAPTTGTNCNDGGGGTADCHDNVISFTCCAHIGIVPPTPEGSSPGVPVNIRLADLPGGDVNTAFYERSTIYIDAVSDPNNKLCAGHRMP